MQLRNCLFTIMKGVFPCKYNNVTPSRLSRSTFLQITWHLVTLARMLSLLRHLLSCPLQYGGSHSQVT